MRSAGDGRARHRRSQTSTRCVQNSRRGCHRPEGDGVRQPSRTREDRAPWSLLAPLGVLCAAGGVDRTLRGQHSSGEFFAADLWIGQPDRLHGRAGFRCCACMFGGEHIATARTMKADICPSTWSLRCRRSARQVVPIRPYAIIASIFNLEDQLDEFMEAFAPYRDRVWLVSDGSTDNTCVRLRHAGWRCFDDGINRRKPGALRRLLERLPAHIETVMVVDPDIRIRATDEGSADRPGAVHRRLPTVGSRRGLSAGDDRARRIPGALPGVRVCAGVPHRASKVWRITASPPASPSIAATRSERALDRAFALGLRGGSGECDHSAEPRRAHLLRRHGWSSAPKGPARGAAGSRNVSAGTTAFSRFTSNDSARSGVISRRPPFAMYHFIVYLGVLSLALHLLKIVSVALLIVSFASGFDKLFWPNLVPHGRAGRIRPISPPRLAAISRSA